ncbi:MAG: MnhB domain-containing protein [Verrucomicrobiota bacterium]
MNSFILKQAGHILFPALLVLSLIELYRGHNLPGGGFIGGLLAACAFILFALGESMEAAARRLKFSPVTLLIVGLSISVFSGILGFVAGESFMVGLWLPEFSLPLVGKVHLGTPVLFDVGVYFVVIGFTLQSVFSLSALAEPRGEETDD